MCVATPVPSPTESTHTASNGGLHGRNPPTSMRASASRCALTSQRLFSNSQRTAASYPAASGADPSAAHSSAEDATRRTRASGTIFVVSCAIPAAPSDACAGNRTLTLRPERRTPWVCRHCTSTPNKTGARVASVARPFPRRLCAQWLHGAREDATRDQRRPMRGGLPRASAGRCVSVVFVVVLLLLVAVHGGGGSTVPKAHNPPRGPRRCIHHVHGIIMIEWLHIQHSGLAIRQTREQSRGKSRTVAAQRGPGPQRADDATLLGLEPC